MGSPYVYQPFESPDLFRLVKLLPGTEDEPLHIELRTYHLDNAPAFDTLSHVWGRKGVNHHVICGGCELAVMPNLYHTLRSLRHARASRLLWIDAISINQQDENERKSTIQVVRQIYQLASRTLCCITHGNIRSLKDFINYTQSLSHYQRAVTHLSQAKDIFRSASKITYQDLQDFEDSVAQKQIGFDKSGVDELLQHPYFCRYAYISRTYIE
jgi:hypothetical protein